jgi:hypothetical protein
LLDGAAAYLLPDTKVNVKSLTDAKGCASTSAVALVQQLGLQIANGSPKVSDAPAHAYNSGTDVQGVIANGDPGISGNRKAVKITAKDGTDVWIMARCGNAVRPGPPPVRHKPPKTPTTSTYPPPPTTAPTCVKFPPPNGDYNDYEWSWGVCNWHKKPQSGECQQNGGPNCPPNPAHQPPQSPGNSVQSTATQTPSGVPTTAPKPLPTYTPPKSAPHAPPTTNNSSGYTPPSSTAPGGGAGPTSGPATTVRSPKPDPTPSCSVSCGTATQTSSPPMPG